MFNGRFAAPDLPSPDPSLANSVRNIPTIGAPNNGAVARDGGGGGRIRVDGGGTNEEEDDDDFGLLHRRWAATGDSPSSNSQTSATYRNPGRIGRHSADPSSLPLVWLLFTICLSLLFWSLAYAAYKIVQWAAALIINDGIGEKYMEAR